MQFATPAQFIKRFDARRVGQLVSDDNDEVSPEGLASDAVLSELLDDATAEMVGALLVGGRYTIDEIEGLTGYAETLRVRICCDIARALLLRRRLAQDPDQDKAEIELAESWLEKLTAGEAIFGLDAVIDATEPTVTGPTTVELRQLNLMRHRTQNYYPAQRLPHDR